MFEPEDIAQILRASRTRPRYIVSVLEFQLGRKPTQEEVDAVNRDSRLRKLAHAKWLALQPWNTRKTYVERSERIKRVLMERYKVPESLILMYRDEFDYD